MSVLDHKAFVFESLDHVARALICVVQRLTDNKFWHLKETLGLLPLGDGLDTVMHLVHQRFVEFLFVVAATLLVVVQFTNVESRGRFTTIALCSRPFLYHTIVCGRKHM